jgi:hypothetical protein
MNNLKLVFDDGELNVLYSVFAMLKYGVEDEYRMLRVISSPIFKKLNDLIYNNQIISVNESLPEGHKIPLNEYIEEQEIPFKALKNYAKKCIEMYIKSEEGNWSKWSEDAKRNLIINLSSPFLIKKNTIDEILNL